MADFNDIINAAKSTFDSYKNPPELDKTKEALEEVTKESLKKLKEGMELDLNALMLRIHDAFIIDLKEVGIDDPAEQEKYWKKVEAKMTSYIEKLKQGNIEASEEFKDLEKFRTNIENLSGLTTIINDKNPMAKAKGWLDKLPGPIKSWIAAAVAGWAISAEDEKGWLAAPLRKLSMALGINPDVKRLENEIADAKKQKKADVMKQKAEELREIDPENKLAAKILGSVAKTTPTAPQNAPTATPAEAKAPEATSELSLKEQEMVKKFTDLGFIFDVKTFKEDKKALEAVNIKEDDIPQKINEALAQNGNLKKILEAVKTATDNKPLTVRLLDLKLQSRAEKDIKLMVAIIENKDKDYKPLDKTPEKIREFLDASHKEADLSKALATYKK